MRKVLSFSAFLFVVLCCAHFGFAQDKLRRVEQPEKFTYPNTPIQVVVNLDDKPMLNRESRAGSDWLKRISLEITNTSGKDIRFLSINLILREGSAQITTIVIPIGLENSEPQIKLLAAGDRAVFRTYDKAVDLWLNHLKEQGLTNDVEKVILDIRQVGFTDRTGWFRGLLTRTDPESGLSSIRQAAQLTEGSRTIVSLRRDNAPIVITSFNLGEKRYELDKSFKAQPDWFKDISFNIENTSTKSIRFVDVAITVMPPPDSNHILPYRYNIWSGQKSAALHKRDSGLLFSPSAERSFREKELRVAMENPEKQFLSTRETLDRLGFPRVIPEVQVHVLEVVFDDGTLWTLGKWYKLDTGGTEELIQIDDEGKGRRGQKR